MGFSALTGSAIHACTAAPQGPRAERPDCSRTAGVQRHADAIAHRDRQIAPSADFVVPIVQHRRSDRCRYVRDPKCQSTLIRTDLDSVRYPICATLSRL